MTRAAACLAVLLALSAPAAAGDRSAAALDQALLDLSSDLRVAFVAALPGDEHRSTLAYLRRGLGVETTILFLTKGEGGLSVSGSELNDDLAMVRAREAMEAAAAIGATTDFLALPDIGLTSSADEVFRIWGREEVVRRLALALRQVRPHVVLLGTGDGRREAARIALLDAVVAAADPGKWPDRFEAWTVSRVWIASGAKGSGATVPIGAVDPVRGLSWAEMGARAGAAYVSLGLDRRTVNVVGPPRDYRLLHGEAGEEASLLGGLPVPRPEWRTGEARAGTREEILERVLALKERPEAERPAANRIDRAAALAQGLDIVLVPPVRQVVFGEKVAVKAYLRNGGNRPVRWGEEEELAPQSVARLPDVEFHSGAKSPGARATVSVLLGEKAVPVALTASADVPVQPVLELRVAPWGRLFRPATDPGDLEQEISRFWVEIVNNGKEAREEVLRLRLKGTDRLEVVEPGPVSVPAGGRRWVRIELHGKKDLEDGLYPVEVRWGPVAVSDSLRVLDVRIVGDLNVGVVATIGDDIVQFLHSLGIRPTLLSDQDLIERDLSWFNTIWLGIRAYHERPVLQRVNDRLLAYVRGGGHLVVNVQHPGEWSSSYAPWPLTIGRDRVDEEDAPVRIAEPGHRLLTFPNQVEAADFGGWRTERALWLPSSWDREHYRVLLTSGDRGAAPGPGLLFAKAGKGTYVYTSFTWFRQLRNLNPGAMKMIANVISHAWR
ncbi:MAG: PIG-L family deacetylase [Planctomycetota bacterium]